MTLVNITMKKNYKTTIVLGTAFAVIAAGIFSDSAFAVVRTNFCANLNQAVSVLDQGIITREGVLKTRQNERLQNLKNIPGRMEKIDESQNFLVFVDYAHEREGMTAILDTARDLTVPVPILPTY